MIALAHPVDGNGDIASRKSIYVLDNGLKKNTSKEWLTSVILIRRQNVKKERVSAEYNVCVLRNQLHISISIWCDKGLTFHIVLFRIHYFPPLCITKLTASTVRKQHAKPGSSFLQKTIRALY